VSTRVRVGSLGGPDGQERFLNCVVRLETPASAQGSSSRRRTGSKQLAGRVRTVRNGPRSLDVDVLLVGDLNVRGARLGRATSEDVRSAVSVLAPLEDLDASRVPKGWRSKARPRRIRCLSSLHNGCRLGEN